MLQSKRDPASGQLLALYRDDSQNRTATTKAKNKNNFKG
jgi:hypothetical protein